MKRLERRRAKRLKAKRCRHYYVMFGYWSALEDAELKDHWSQRYYEYLGPTRFWAYIREGLNRPMKYVDNLAMHKDTDDYWCPYRRDRKKADLDFNEQLQEFKNREELDRIYSDYWSRPWGLMDEWSSNHPDLTDDWDWDELDYEIMESYRAT